MSEELAFKNAIEAKRAIAYYLVKPLAKLTPEQVESYYFGSVSK